MRVRISCSFAVGATLVGFACGGRPDAQLEPSGAGAEDAGLPVSAPPPRADEAEVKEACARRANAAWARYPAIPPEDRAARIAVSEAQCKEDALAPGSRIGAAFINACADALLDRDPCLIHDPIECVPPPGSRANGASCDAPHQCASGNCARQSVLGRTITVGCGRCAPASSVAADWYYQSCPLGTVPRVIKKPTGGMLNLEVGAEVTCVAPSRDSDRYDFPPREIDGACSVDGDCAGVLRCVAGQCSAAREGEACSTTFGGAASTFLCDPALACVDGRCRKRSVRIRSTKRVRESRGRITGRRRSAARVEREASDRIGVE